MNRTQTLAGAFFVLVLGGSRAMGGAGSTVLDILTSPTNPRLCAFGGGGAALGDDAASGSLNPAGWGRLSRGEAYFENCQGVVGINSQTAGIALPTVRHGVWTGRMSLTDYGDIPSADEGGSIGNAFQARDLWIQGGWAGRVFTERTWSGVSVNYANEKIADQSASTMFVDLGILHRIPASAHFPGARVGVSLLRCGPDVRYGTDRFALPREWRVGGAMSLWRERMTLVNDFIFQRDEAPGFGAGAEYAANGSAFFRLGYSSLSDTGGGWTYGIGFRAWELEFNYAFTPSAKIGDEHRLGLVFRFGGLAEKYVALGQDALRGQDYPRAVLYFNRALSVDPHHTEAIRGLREAAAKLSPS